MTNEPHMKDRVESMVSKDATVKIVLKADSGYRAEATARISPAQWAAINAIIDESK